MKPVTKRPALYGALLALAAIALQCGGGNSRPAPGAGGNGPAPGSTAPDTTPPALVSITPSADSQSVSPGAVITVTFNEPVKPETVRLQLHSGNRNAYLDLASSANGASVTFTPSQQTPLTCGDRYSVTLVSGVQDLAGNILQETNALEFTTAGAPAAGFQVVVQDATAGANTRTDAKALKTDAFGNIYFAGNTNGNLAPRDGRQASDTDMDGFIVKYDCSGAEIWRRQAGTGLMHEYFDSLALDPAGNVYVAGNDNGGGFLARYSPSGDLIGELRIGSSGTQVRSVAVDGQGVFVGGTTSETLAAAPVSPSGSDIFVHRYTLELVRTHDFQYGFFNGSGDMLRGLQASGGSVYLAGSTNGHVIPPRVPGMPPPVVRNDRDIFWMRLNAADLSMALLRRAGSTANDEVKDLDAHAGGNSAVVGYTEGNLIAANGGLSDVFIIVYDPDGNMALADQGTGPQELYAEDVAMDVLGNPVVIQSCSDCSTLGTPSFVTYLEETNLQLPDTYAVPGLILVQDAWILHVDGYDTYLAGSVNEGGVRRVFWRKDRVHPPVS